MTASPKINAWDEDTKRVLGFFVAKGFLIAPGVKPLPSVKLAIDEVIEIGLSVEPRVLEVLPGAMLRFPRSFLHWDRVPEKLKVVLDCLRKNLNDGPSLGGLPYTDLKKWADHQLKDGRTVPNCEKRVRKYWKLHPITIEEIRRQAEAAGISEGEVIERVFKQKEPA
jgi:hypothetical protein